MHFALLLVVALTGLTSSALAQAPAPPPPLIPCGTSTPAMQVYCGTRAPEDLEITPDGKFLIITQFQRNPPIGLSLFELASKQYSPLAVTNEPDKSWGDPACPGPLTTPVGGHGSSLARRKSGAWQLFIVNHAGRESVEMYELRKSGNSWTSIWRGCVISAKDFNDVAALEDGSFIATHPTALDANGGAIGNVLDGHPSGYVVRWTRDKGEVEFPGTRFGYPNGVVAAKDGKTFYYAAWTNKALHKYDAVAGKETGLVNLGFMPDNISWTSNGKLLAAGIMAARGNCGNLPCQQRYGTAQVDPSSFRLERQFQSPDEAPAIMQGVSIAFQVGQTTFLGAFAGDRIAAVRTEK